MNFKQKSWSIWDSFFVLFCIILFFPFYLIWNFISNIIYKAFNLITMMFYNFQLKAKDMDCGSNAIVSYTFQDESSSDTFNIGNKDGKMCLAQELDHEAKDVHNVIVLATDKGIHISSYNPPSPINYTGLNTGLFFEWP